jgi:hypothetical protein
MGQPGWLAVKAAYERDQKCRAQPDNSGDSGLRAIGPVRLEQTMTDAGKLLQLMTNAADQAPPFRAAYSRLLRHDGEERRTVLDAAVAPEGRWLAFEPDGREPYAGRDGQRIWRRAGSSRRHTENPIRRLSDPSWLLNGRRIERVGTGSYEGRQVVYCRAVMREIPLGPDRRLEVTFSIDTESGIALELRQGNDAGFFSEESLHDISFDRGQALLEADAFTMPPTAVVLPPPFTREAGPDGRYGPPDRVLRAAVHLTAAVRELFRRG